MSSEVGAEPLRMSTWEGELVPSVAPWVAGTRICVLHPSGTLPFWARATIQLLQDCTVTRGSLQPQNSDTLCSDLVHSTDILRSQVWPKMGCTHHSAPHRAPSFPVLCM